MKKIGFVFLFLFSLSYILRSQTELPYGGLSVWYRSDSLSFGSPVWLDASGQGRDGRRMGLSGFDSSCINFHKVISFSGLASVFSSRYDRLVSGRLTVLTVYYSSDTTFEQGLWSFYSGGHQVSGLSDRRLYRGLTGFSYPVYRRGLVSVNTSKQSLSRRRLLSDSSVFYLGGSCFGDSVLHYFKGEMAECLVWSRILDKSETLIAESYLALKYGITLLSSDYLSSQGLKVWDYSSNGLYSHNIAGLCRDDIWGLYQKQSGSSGIGDSLTISLGDSIYTYNSENPCILANGSYLVWGHNGLGLSVDSVCGDGYLLFPRRWMLQSTHSDSNYLTTVRYPSSSLLSDSLSSLYLLIDRSGLGDFTSAEVIPPTRRDSHYVYYHSVVWDTDLSGRDVFGFGYGISVDLVGDTICSQTATGNVKIRLCGGFPPYDCTVSDSAGNIFHHQLLGDSVLTGLWSGRYRVLIADSRGSSIEREVMISEYVPMSIDTPSHDMYVGDALEGSDLISGGDVCYWLNPDSVIYESCSIVFSDTGFYRLVVSDIHGCLASTEVSVGAWVNSLLEVLERDTFGTSSDNFFPRYRAYPNPSSGWFVLEAALTGSMPLRIEIYTLHGQLLDRIERTGSRYYRLESYQAVPGEYIVRFISADGAVDKKLTIQP